MKKEITVTLMPGFGESTFTFQYGTSDGKQRILTQEWEVEYIRGTEKDKEKLANIMKAVNIKINRPFRFEFETEKSKQSELDAAKQKAFDIFFNEHPACLINEVPNPATVVQIFNVIDPAEKVNLQYQLRMQKKRVNAIIDEMDAKQLRDVCHWAMLPVVPQSPEEMIVALVGDSGHLFTAKGNQTAVQVAQKFLDAWDGENADREFLINIRKAISYGIITKEDNNGMNIYYLNNTNLGSSVNSCVSWAKENAVTYQSYVVAPVAEKDRNWKPANIDSKHQTAAAETKAKTLSEEEKDALIEEAEALQKQGYLENSLIPTTMRTSNLIDVVERGRVNKIKGNIVNAAVKRQMAKA